MNFSLTNEEAEKSNSWYKKHIKNCKYKDNPGSIGGAISYRFTTTSLGIISSIECACGGKEVLTNFDDF